MWRLGGRAFIQTGHWRFALTCTDLIVDLNPRSLTAWLFLVARRARRQRTLVWGHLYPQAGPAGPSAALRRAMRWLASGTITYTFSNLEDAIREMPNRPAWVAPNALYTSQQIQPATGQDQERKDFLYVGRLEPPKKVALAVSAFARSGLWREGARLVIVGDGSQREFLRRLSSDLAIADHVIFQGWNSSWEFLFEHYRTAVCALSTGFAGLGLTQALGFGVPVLVARSEPHSPEIELAATGAVHWFDSDDEFALADGLHSAWQARESVPLGSVSSHVKELYSAERMAHGLLSALIGAQ
ncbi:glycosyltransferase [Nocardioides oceani]|uniref:glycosyltransferase n=1 Tax=Nocardioides oceani TaxID=3058369 RepID=UPI0034DE2F0A